MPSTYRVPALLFALLSAAYAAAAPIKIYTVNYPLQYFAQRIGGEHAEVVFPAPAEVDPANWRPTPEQVIAYQGADLILLNGAGYADWVTQVTLPQLRLVNTSAEFENDYITMADAVRHSHGPSGKHSHRATAFTTWLDFKQAVMQAEAILRALTKRKPDREGVFLENFESLKKDLIELDRSMMDAANKLAGAPLIFSHPVYQYMERRYGLKGKSVHWEPDQDIGAEQWQELRRLLAEHPACLMVWEDTPLPSTARRLHEMDIQVVVFITAANAAKTDFLTVMRENVRRFERATR